MEPINRAEAGKQNGKWVVPTEFAEDTEGRIIIEAESAAEFTGTKKPDGVSYIGTDPLAGGRKYVQRMLHGAYVFRVSKPQIYQVWYRAQFPFAGNWLHNESLDNSGIKYTNYDYEAAVPKTVRKWVWVKGKTYKLAAGSHILSLDWQGGALLDQIALLPKGHPVPNGKTFSAHIRSKTGTINIDLKPLYLSKNETVSSVDYRSLSKNGTVQLMYSCNDGKSFSPYKGNAVPAASRILFRLRVSPQNGKYPEFSDIKVHTNQPVSTEMLPKTVRTMMKKISSFELTGCSWSGMRIKDNVWHLANAVVPDDKGILWLDALHADHTVIAPKNISWFMDDADAYHGKALYQGLLNRNMLSYDCNIRKSGKYRPWFRVKLLHNAKKYKTGIFAFGVTYNVNLPYIPLMYQVDDADPVEFSKNDKPFPKKDFLKSEWVWIPAPKINLSAGPHTFRLRAGLDFMLLDRIALIPEKSSFIPSGKGSPSLRKYNEYGEIVFQKLDIHKKISLLAAEKNSNMKMSWFGSDNGNTWYPVSAGAAVPSFLKVVCKAKTADSPATAENFTLTVDTPCSYAVFNCGQQQFWFDPFQGALAGWKNSKGKWVIPLGERQKELFKLMSVVFQPNGLAVKTPLNFNFTGIRGDKKGLYLDYQAQNNTLKGTISVSPETDGLAKWKLSLYDNTNLELRDPEFPRLKNIRLATDPEEVFAVATQPNFGGVDFTAAPLNIASPGKAFTGFKASFAGTYPGWFAMGWSAFYTQGKGSFTIQNRNPDAVAVTFDSAAGKNAIHSSLIRKIYIAPKEKAEVSYALGWQNGDWHTPADCYSKWAHSWMDFSRVNSNWIRNSDGWVACYYYYDSAYIPTRYPTHMAPEMRWMGTQHFMMFYNCIDQVPGPANYPFVNTKLGTVAEYNTLFGLTFYKYMLYYPLINYYGGYDNGST